MLGAFRGGGKYSLSCVRAVAVNGLLEEKPDCRLIEHPMHGVSNGVYEPSTKFWTAWESFVAALLLTSEATVGLAGAYMYDQILVVGLWRCWIVDSQKFEECFF